MTFWLLSNKSLDTGHEQNGVEYGVINDTSLNPEIPSK